jgi:hypothetical protein
MGYDIFQPNQVKNAGVVFNLNIPSGVAMQVEVFIGPNPTTKTATSNKKPFTTPTPNTNTASVACPITMPATSGVLNEYIFLYDAAGNVAFSWINVNQLVVISGTATITWS